MIQVLHVDDDPEFTALTREYLRRESERFVVTAETDASAALDRLRDPDVAVDCVVSDYALPGTDGLELLEAVREREPELPFILFTGQGSEAVAGDALARGATEYLRKQRGTEQYALLANRIVNAVEQYRARREEARTERYRRELHRVTADTTLRTEEKVARLLELGCDRLGVENGHVVRIDQGAGRHEVWLAAGTDFVEADTVTDLEETYCRETVGSEEVLAVFNAPAEGWGDDPAYERWDIGCYIGSRLVVRDDPYGTVCFVDQRPREQSFSQPERTFVDRVARWIEYLLERERHTAERRAFELAVDTVPDGVFLVDGGGEFTMVNDAMVALTGRSRDALVGTSLAEVFEETPEARGDGAVASLATAVLTADGEAVPVEIRSRSFAGADGAEAWWVAGVVRDVSGRGGDARSRDDGER